MRRGLRAKTLEEAPGSEGGGRGKLALLGVVAVLGGAAALLALKGWIETRMGGGHTSVVYPEEVVEGPIALPVVPASTGGSEAPPPPAGGAPITEGEKAASPGAGEVVDVPLPGLRVKEKGTRDPFLYEGTSKPAGGGLPVPLRVPALPGVPSLPGLPPLPPPVEVLAVAGGQAGAVALKVGGDIMTLRAGETVTWEEAGVQQRLTVRRISGSQVVVIYNGKTFMLKIGGAR